MYSDTIDFETPDYKIDAKGNHIRVENIREIDLLRDRLVYEMVPKFKAAQETLRKLKANALDDIAAFVELSAERFEIKIGGEKGNVTLISFDGRYKVTRAMADNMTFDERLLAAQALIGKCLQKWSTDSNPNLISFVNQAFKKDKDGNVSVSAVLRLRALKIEDEEWSRAMDAISESLQVVYSRSYVRIHERDQHGGWQPISLDFSKL